MPTSNPTSNPTPNCCEFKVYDLFPMSPEVPPPEPTNAELKQQLDESNMEVANLNQRLSRVSAQINMSVEEAVMVSEAHLEQRMDNRLDDMEEMMLNKLEENVDARVKLEMFFASVYVFVVCMLGALMAKYMYQ